MLKQNKTPKSNFSPLSIMVDLPPWIFTTCSLVSVGQQYRQVCGKMFLDHKLSYPPRLPLLCWVWSFKFNHYLCNFCVDPGTQDTMSVSVILSAYNSYSHDFSWVWPWSTPWLSQQKMPFVDSAFPVLISFPPPFSLWELGMFLLWEGKGWEHLSNDYFV